jgi:hypothetical protein
MEVLSKRFAKFGLRLHPKKTRVVAFRPKRKRSQTGEQARSFDFLGFRFHWAKGRRGGWVVKTKTAPPRLQRFLDRVRAYCARYRHRPIAEQHGQLSRMLRGHYGYFGGARQPPGIGARPLPHVSDLGSMAEPAVAATAVLAQGRAPIRGVLAATGPNRVAAHLA